MKITAVVVTFNRLALLQRNLLALHNQSLVPDCILVVDNASTDGTREWLLQWQQKHPEIAKILALEINSGGAGGFSTGMRAAMKDGADWIWVMDDDCIPEPDCLEKLIAAPEFLPEESRKNIGFLASRILWRDRTPCLMNLPSPHYLWIEPHEQSSNLTRLSASSFVSMLINRRAIENHGLPVKEFFIWFDDFEFSRRISTEMPCYLVSNSIAIHETESNTAALDFTKITDASLWKFSFGIRNEASFNFEINGFLSGVFFCLKILTRAMRHTKNWHHRLSVAKACWNGFRFHYTKFIEYI